MLHIMYIYIYIYIYIHNVPSGNKPGCSKPGFSVQGVFLPAREHSVRSYIIA